MTMNDRPIYLVQDQQGVLHGHWRRDVLKIDLLVNKQDPPKAIYKLGRERLRVRYKRLISRV